MPATFEGFTPDAVRFLLELRANNDRAWFQPRKAEYERLLKGPLEALCVVLGEQFEARGIPLRGRRPLPVSHLPRRPLLKGQVSLQGSRQRQLRVGRRGCAIGAARQDHGRARRRRLLPFRSR